MLFCDPFCTSSSKLLQPGRHSRSILRSYGCRRKQLHYFQAWMFSPRVQRFRDLFWSQHGRWPVSPSDTRNVSHTFQISSGNYLPVVLVFLVMYTTDAVVFESCLMVGGVEVEFGTFQGRQFLLVKGQAMMGKDAAAIVGNCFCGAVFWCWSQSSAFGLY